MSLLSEFKKFRLRGNVVDLTVAVVVAAAMFFLVVALTNLLMNRRAQEDPDEKECPECTSSIPSRARRCPLCRAELSTG